MSGAKLHNSEMTSAEDAVKSSWMSVNGIFDPAKISSGLVVATNTVNTTPTGCIRESLHRHWRLATQGFADGRTSSSEQQSRRDHLLLLETWFDRLVTLYSEDARHYHTTVHLWEMIQYMDLLLPWSEYTDALLQPEDVPVVLLLSIFFHDAIYDTKSASNEEDSAKLFQSFAEELRGIPFPIRTRVVDYILATKTHQISDSSSSTTATTQHSALALFLDLDMAVLGKQPAAYHQYAALIRQEYNASIVSHDEYCRRRADVLANLLQQQPRIYITSVLHQALEQQARTNLQKEIESLRNGVIPGTSAGVADGDE